jgi:glutamate-5-semialdehyde dehydrogenase
MTIEELSKQAKLGLKDLLHLSSSAKNSILEALKTLLNTRRKEIKLANQKDIEYAKEIGLKESLIERLTITDKTIDSMIKGISDVIDLPDPIGKVLDTFTRPNGLIISKISVPLGVIGMIYESRPNVTIDAFALSFKSSNAVILKGGKEAIHSNRILCKLVQEVLESFSISPSVIQLFEPKSRQETKTMMHANGYIDVLIPRGSKHLIETVVNESSVPVIETGAGNCHVYVDASANLQMAVEIAYNAKVSRPSVCNSCETILLHKDIAKEFSVKIKERFSNLVQIIGDERINQYIIGSEEVTEDDYYKEYNDYIVTIKVVEDLEEAIGHINHYSTHHSEAIVAENKEAVKQFFLEVDSAAIYHNASTRFTDGYEFGMGAEIGISTQKLHVRGPIGLEALCSYKYVIVGEGHIRV